MNPSILSISSLIATPVMSAMSTSWLVMWGLLEINIMSFTALKVKTNEKTEKNEMMSQLKYFMVQSLTSAIIIMIALWSEDNENKNSSKTIMTMALMTKMAASPVHRWFIDLVKTMKFKKSMILMTWQKTIPLFILSMTLNTSTWLFIMTCASVTSVEILNNKKTLEILALSSVFNNSWIISSSVISMMAMMTFTILYWSAVILMMMEMKNQMNNEKKMTTLGENTLLFVINLSSLPPSTGFVAKWYLTVKMVKSGTLMQTSFILILSLINTFTYMRLSSTSFTNNPTTKESKKPLMKMILMMSVTTTLVMLLKLHLDVVIDKSLHVSWTHNPKNYGSLYNEETLATKSRSATHLTSRLESSLQHHYTPQKQTAPKTEKIEI